jgi:hypothetical protein
VVDSTTVEGALLASVRLSAWAQAATVVAGTKDEGAALASVRLLAWAQPATVVAGTTDEGATNAYVLLVGVGPTRHCRVVHDRRRRRSGVSSGSASHCGVRHV